MVTVTSSAAPGLFLKDPQSEPDDGRTNWRRFAICAALPGVVAGALVAGMANGALAASFAVSGQSFKREGGKDAHGDAAMFGQEADAVKIAGLRQTAVSTTAGTFTLNGLNLKVNVAGRQAGRVLLTRP